MKHKKGLILSLLGFSIPLIILAFLATFSRFQTYALNAIFTLNKEQTLKVDRAHIGLHHIQAQGISLRSEDGAIFIQQAQMRLNLLPLIFQQKVQIKEIITTPITITLSSVRDIKAKNTLVFEDDQDEAETVDFEGIFGALRQLDYRFWVKQAALKGSIHSVNGQIVQFHIEAEGIAPGKTGKVWLSSQLQQNKASTQEKPFAAELKSVLALTQDDVQPGFTEVHLDATLSIDHLILPQPKVLRSMIHLVELSHGESYSAVVFQQDPNGAKTTLLNFKSVFDSDEKRLTGQFNVQARPKDLPLDRFPLLPEWDELPIIETQFDLQWYWSNLYLHDLQCRIKDTEGATLAAIKTLQSFAVPLSQKALEVALPKGNLLEVEIMQMPLKFLPFDFGAYSMDGLITGTLVLSEKDNAYTAQSPKPLTLNQFALKQDDRFLFQNLKLTADPELQLKDGTLRFSIKDIQAVNNNLFLFEDTYLQFVIERKNAKWTPIQLEAKGQADLTTLFSLPIFANYNNIESGQLSWKIDGEMFANSRQLTIESGISNITAIDKQQTAQISAIQLSGNIHWDEEEVFSAKLPLTITSSYGASTVFLEGAFNKKADAPSFDIKLSGSSFELYDLLLLADIFKNNDKEKAPETFSGQLESFSDSIDKRLLPYAGEVTLDIQSVSFKNRKVIEGLNSAINFSETGIRLNRMNALFQKAPFTLTGSLLLKNDKMPFFLEVEMRLDQFDVGAFLQESNRQHLPILEGILELKGHLNSQSTDLENLIYQLQGEVVVKGKQGKFNTFAAASNESKKKDAQLPMQLATEGLSIVASFVEDQAKFVFQVNDLINELSVIPYDTLKLKISRSEDLNVIIDELLLFSHDLHLDGQGILRYQEKIPLDQQTLLLPIKLNIKPDSAIAKALNQFRLVEDKINEWGYLHGPTYIQSGTLNEPSNNLQEILTQALIANLSRQKKVDFDKYRQEAPFKEDTSEPSTEHQEENILPFDLEKGMQLLDLFKDR